MENLTNNKFVTPGNSKGRYLTLGLAVILLVLFFVLAAGFFWWWQNCKSTFECKTTESISNFEISGNIIKKNEMIAKLVAQVVRKEIDQLLTVGSVYAGRKELIQFIQQDKWREAVNLTSGIFKEFPGGTIEKIVLADMLGTAKGAIPSDSNVLGTNFAFRDWYRGVTTDFKPYVSEVFQRMSIPRFNVVGLAFPVNNSHDVPIAILLLQIKTDTFQKWLNDIKFGNSGLSFIVDQRGHVVAHPEIPTQGEIANFSSRTEVQKVISGQSGTEISVSSKGKRILVSYEPIPDLHWGIITRIELDELIDSRLIKENTLGQIRGVGDY